MEAAADGTAERIWAPAESCLLGAIRGRPGTGSSPAIGSVHVCSARLGHVGRGMTGQYCPRWTDMSSRLMLWASLLICSELPDSPRRGMTAAGSRLGR